jgi:hypothetical protein
MVVSSHLVNDPLGWDQVSIPGPQGKVREGMDILTHLLRGSRVQELVPPHLQGRGVNPALGLDSTHTRKVSYGAGDRLSLPCHSHRHLS